MHEVYRKFPVLVGLKVQDAVSLIKKEGFSIRIESFDGKKTNLGNAFEPLRVNLTIVDGIVISNTFY